MNKYCLLLLLLLLAACTSPQKEQHTDAPPNILFLFTDDQTFNSIQALGNEEIHTPNLDRLTQMGTTFTHAYNMGGWHGAVCVASRSMIVSGRSVWRAREIEKKYWARDSVAMAQTWMQVMERKGYDTYMAGKWHVGLPADTIFQTTGTVQKGGMPPDYWSALNKEERKKLNEGLKNDAPFHEVVPLGYSRPMSEADTTWQPWDKTHGGFWKGGKHWSEVLRDDAKGFIDQASQKEAPFFMYVAFNAPHDPRQAPKEYVDRYPVEDIKLPANFQAEHPYKNEMGNPKGLRDEALAPFPRTEYAVKKHRQEYYAIISHLDAQIGAILDHLEDSGKMDNTYIFFTADHGLSVGQHGLIGKQSVYDHSMRVPLIITGPDIPKGKRIAADIYLQDLMPTSLELAGIEKPAYVDFNSLLPLIRAEKAANYEEGVYGAYVQYQRMIRKDGFKLILFPNAPKVMLFDMKADPLEMNDLAEDPAQKERVDALFQDLLVLQEKMGDTLNLKKVYPGLIQ